jgi:hypothetical protein
VSKESPDCHSAVAYAAVVDDCGAIGVAAAAAAAALVKDMWVYVKLCGCV